MSLIVAFVPSFVTSVDESTFSVFPDSVSVLFERSRFSTRPISSLALALPLADAVASGLVLPGVEVLGLVLLLPVLPEVLVEVSLLVVEPVVEPVAESEPAEPVVLLEPIVPWLEPLLSLSSASVVLPAKVSSPAVSATAALHPIFLIVSSPQGRGNAAHFRG